MLPTVLFGGRCCHIVRQLLTGAPEDELGGTSKDPHEHCITYCFNSGRHGSMGIHQAVGLFLCTAGGQHLLVYLVSLNRHCKSEDDGRDSDHAGGTTEEFTGSHDTQRG